MKSFISAKPLFNYLTANVTAYAPQEAKAIVFMLLEHHLRLRNVDVMVDKPLSPNSRQPDWDNIVARLNKSEPVQHIIGAAEFCGLTFKVSPSVLIPRPETEELARLIVKDCSEPDQKIKIVDICTGSGCIAIALDRFLPHARVKGWDVSEVALRVARENARELLSDAQFELFDILDASNKTDEKFDCVVSNPPYVTYAEANSMEPNVLRFEPHLALFVEDQDPLLFYRAIADFCRLNLKPEGACYVEINEHFGTATQSLFTEKGFSRVNIVQDMQGKDRMVKAQF